MITALLAALFGLLIGSFLNVCIHRLPRDLSVVRPRSFCPLCEAPVAWYDNVPLLSFLLLRGRCRNCGGPIPLRYPLVEALTAAAFFAAVLLFGLSPAALKACLFSSLLIGLIFSDLEERILPDEMTLGGTLAGLALAAAFPTRGGFVPFFPPSAAPWIPSLAESAAGALIAGGTLWLVGEIYFRIRHRDGLGLGDVKMVAMIGAFLGLQGVLLTLILGSVLGSITGVLYIVLSGKDVATYKLPFGTFLGIAALGVLFAGGPLLHVYSPFGQ